MERAQDLSTGSPKDVSGSFDTRVLIPVQLPTLNILASWFKEGSKSTNFEQFHEALNKIFQDPVLSGFMVDYFNHGTKLLMGHGAISRGGLNILTRNKRDKNAVGEETSMRDSSGNKGDTNVDGMFIDMLPELVGAKATAVGPERNVSVDMLQELDEAEATGVGAEAVGIDEADDDQTCGDQTDDGETGDDQTDDGETGDDQTDDDEIDVDETCDDLGTYHADRVLIRNTRSLIEKQIDDPNIVHLAENIANDEGLIEISNKILEPLRSADGITSLHAFQHSEAVALFWKNECFIKWLREELVESVYLVDELYYLSTQFTAEPPGDRMIRIKADPSCKKVLDTDDRVVRMSGVLSIITGYWINKDVLRELAKALDGPDLPRYVKGQLNSWSR